MFTVLAPAAVAVVSPPSVAHASECICRTATQCTCLDNADTKRREVKRLDAAGRDAAQAKREAEAYRNMYAGTSTAQDKKQQQAPKGAPQGASAMPPPPINDRGGLTGYGSMEYGEINVAAAKKRFNDILAETVARREAEYGFELDADDIKQVESVLRIKYCGPQGLIGPC